MELYDLYLCYIFQRPACSLSYILEDRKHNWTDKVCIIKIIRVIPHFNWHFVDISDPNTYVIQWMTLNGYREIYLGLYDEY